jgi:single-strand DNA-binding protein
VFETNIVVVGNVLAPPELRVTGSNQSVVNFRVASTARRFDREASRWVDGHHLRVRVNCWRRLAEGVAASITVGDPVVVAGRLYTRDWTDSEGNPRTSYEMEAMAVGHDLARGRSRFYRNRPASVTSGADGGDADGIVRGEPAELMPEDMISVRYGDGLPDGPEPGLPDLTPSELTPSEPRRVLDPVAQLIAGEGSEDDDDEEEEELTPVEEEVAPAGRRRSRRAAGREPVAV